MSYHPAGSPIATRYQPGGTFAAPPASSNRPSADRVAVCRVPPAARSGSGTNTITPPDSGRPWNVTTPPTFAGSGVPVFPQPYRTARVKASPSTVSPAPVRATVAPPNRWNRLNP